MAQKDENTLVGVTVSQFSNGLHWEYVSEVSALLKKYNFKPLGIEPFYEPFEIAIQNYELANARISNNGVDCFILAQPNS